MGERAIELLGNKLKLFVWEFFLHNDSFSKTEYDREKAEAAFYDLLDCFAEIMMLCAKNANKKMTYELYNTEIEDVIPKITLKSNDGNIEITIGLFRDFFLTAKINSADGIKDMNDLFWLEILEFMKLGKFGFYETDVNIKSIKSKYPIMFGKRSNFFKMIRNYILSHAEGERIYRFGIISLEWDRDKIDYPDLLNNFLRAFKYAHSINNMLRIKALKSGNTD